MDSENEKNFGEKPVEQNNSSREGFSTASSQAGNNNPTYRAGRSPRPRIHIQRPITEQRPYRRHDDEEGFRPEGFGAGLSNGMQQRRSYNTHYNNEGSYGGQHWSNNYNRGGQRDGYQQRPGGYNQQPRQNGGYQQRPGGYSQQSRQNGGYQQRQNGGYQQRSGYQQRPGGYGQQPRQNGGYQQRPGGYQQRSGYQQRPGGYGQQRGGYQQRQHTSDYDPNAKYSLKKRIEYKEENFDPNEPVRLNKFLANAGICSRREADEFIQAGVIKVNDVVVTELGTKIMRTDKVLFHDQPVSLEKKVYVLLNKPKDYVTTSDDPQQRKTVMDLVKDACSERIYPVGRLDRNTTGVLLLTNDGDLASKLTHPKFLKKKIYHVFLDKNVTAHDMEQIANGIELEDGEIKADDIQYADPKDKKQVGIEIHSGKNRIVRRIFESLGYRVIKLDRVQFAGLTKKNLKRGDWRYLTEDEVDRLRMGAYE